MVGSEQLLVCQYRSVSGRNDGSKNHRKFEKRSLLSTELTKMDDIFTFCVTFDKGLEYLKDSSLNMGFFSSQVFLRTGFVDPLVFLFFGYAWI